MGKSDLCWHHRHDIDLCVSTGLAFRVGETLIIRSDNSYHGLRYTVWTRLFWWAIIGCILGWRFRTDSYFDSSHQILLLYHRFFYQWHCLLINGKTYAFYIHLFCETKQTRISLMGLKNFKRTSISITITVSPVAVTLVLSLTQHLHHHHISHHCDTALVSTSVWLWLVWVWLWVWL